jgi:hypothetical protein
MGDGPLYVGHSDANQVRTRGHRRTLKPFRRLITSGLRRPTAGSVSRSVGAERRTRCG